MKTLLKHLACLAVLCAVIVAGQSSCKKTNTVNQGLSQHQIDSIAHRDSILRQDSIALGLVLRQDSLYIGKYAGIAHNIKYSTPTGPPDYDSVSVDTIAVSMNAAGALYVDHVNQYYIDTPSRGNSYVIYREARPFGGSVMYLNGDSINLNYVYDMGTARSTSYFFAGRKYR